MAQTTRFILNGKPVAVETEGARPLLWVLRGDLGTPAPSTGVAGICGTCTVLIEGRPSAPAWFRSPTWPASA